MSLLAPAFLVGLLAIGLPWWLHRLSSDNPNKQRFSSLMFLEPGEPRRVLAKNTIASTVEITMLDRPIIASHRGCRIHCSAPGSKAARSPIFWEPTMSVATSSRA